MQRPNEGSEEWGLTQRASALISSLAYQVMPKTISANESTLNQDVVHTNKAKHWRRGSSRPISLLAPKGEEKSS